MNIKKENKIKNLNITQNIKIIGLYLLCILMFLLTGCNASKTDLYNYGLKAATLMEEMIKNEDLKDLLLSYSSSNSGFDNFIANDYDSPTNTYKIELPENYQKYINIRFQDTPELIEKFNNLPEHIKNQLLNSINFQTIVLNIIIEYCDIVDGIDIAINYTTNLIFDGKIEKETAYLYTFETGQPIIVIFKPFENKIQATGIFIPIQEVLTLSGTREIFEIYDCFVEKLEI